MSKFVKDLEMKELHRRFEGVSDVVLVNVVGLDAIADHKLRSELRKKGIQLSVVKNSLLRLVFEKNGHGAALKDLSGPSAVAWGGEGIVELAKEITTWAKKIEKLQVKGGCVSGVALDAAGVEALSKMPSRPDLLGRIVSQILAPGANLAAQLLGPGAMLASQVKSIAEKEGEAKEEAPAAEAAASA